MNTLQKYIMVAILSLFSINVLAGTCRVNSKHSPIPKQISNKNYHQARKLLMKNGWQPIQTVNHLEASNMFDYGGNFETFWKRGYREVESCAGTGLAPCKFNFRDIYGNTLSVFTSGEEDTSRRPKYYANVNELTLECR